MFTSYILPASVPLLRGGVVACAMAGVCHFYNYKGHTPAPLNRGASRANPLNILDNV
jgi:hypothetical protein